MFTLVCGCGCVCVCVWIVYAFHVCGGDLCVCVGSFGVFMCGCVGVIGFFFVHVIFLFGLWEWLTFLWLFNDLCVGMCILSACGVFLVWSVGLYVLFRCVCVCGVCG